MGCCDIIPNNSVHWNITHETETGEHKDRNGRPRSEAWGDADDTVTVETTVTRGIDPVRHGIGKGNTKGSPQGHADKLRVTLRFPNRDEAVKELQRAAKAMENAQADPNTGLYAADVDVKAEPTTESKTLDHPRNPYAQVCVEW
ncbi:MAG: hypothetical protein HY655_09780 [Acidobacteria bacterium]|nr:hypothetical protein [Acidobacteriota bacterium]